MPQSFNISDHIHFGKGAKELIGTVVDIKEKGINIIGVERGCCCSQMFMFHIDQLGYVKKIEEALWQKMITEEPALQQNNDFAAQLVVANL